MKICRQSATDFLVILCATVASMISHIIIGGHEKKCSERLAFNFGCYIFLNMESQTVNRSICLAVLPLQVLSDDPTVKMFCQGLVMDLITDLSRFRSFQIIAYDTTKGFHPNEQPDSPKLDALHLDLEKYPENGWSLSGLQQSLVAQGKSEEAKAMKARFEKAWASSDVTLEGSRF
jgi:hypothetical protein